MRFFKGLTSVLSRACVFFTLITVLFYIIANAAVESEVAIDFVRMLYILLFSLIVSVANLIFKAKKVPIFFRILIHYIIVGFFATYAFMKLGEGTSSFRTALVILGVLALIYALVSTVAALIRMKIRRDESDREKYVPQFAEITGNKDGKKNRS